MKRRLFLNVVVRKSAAIFELFTSEDLKRTELTIFSKSFKFVYQTLLIWRNAFLVLDLGLHILNGVRCLHLKSDCLASQSFDEYLHPTTKTKDQMKRGLLLNVVIRESAAIFELLSGKDLSGVLYIFVFLS
jgi:hypothetical protein